MVSATNHWSIIFSHWNLSTQKFYLIDKKTLQVSTIVGTGQNFDNGDGGMAINASLYHPLDVIYDSVGNLYITTERGLIRKVDPTGRISTFAGNINGQLLDSAHALDMYFYKPHGMVIDEENGYFYVADTGNKRVVQIDMINMMAKNVAGSGSCGTTNFKDGVAGLMANLCEPKNIGLDENKNLLIADSGNERMLRLSFTASQFGKMAFRSIKQDNSKIEREADGTFTRTYRSGAVSRFNQKGLQTSISDRTGKVVTFAYDLQDRLTSILDATGSETLYNYSGDHLSSITDQSGRVTNFYYDGSHLQKVIFPDGSQRSFAYNSSGILLSELDQKGGETSYNYNQWNRLQKIIRADDTTILVNDAQSNVLANGSSLLPKILQSLGEGGIAHSIKNAKGVETKMIQGSDGFISKIIDGDGKVTEIERDSEGRPTKITRPDSTYTSFVYSSTTGDLLEKFDSSSNLKEEFSYDTFGNLLTKKDFRGVVLSNSYHATTGQLLSSTNILGQTSSQTYLPNGLVANKTDVLGRITSFIYDPDGNLVKSVFPDGKAVEVIRDNAGNVTSKTDASGRTTFYEFDIMNRLTKVTTPKGEETSYVYDQVGSLSKITDPYGNITTFEYDSLNRLTKKTDPLGRVTTLGYDSNGNLVHEIDPMGRSKIYQYDNLDQLVKRVLPDNIYEMSYDVRGNLILSKNNETKIEFEYDLINGNAVVAAARTSGLNTHADLPQATIEYFYDELGNRIQMSTPNGNFTYAYDIGSRLTGIRNASGENFAFNYDQGNRITKITRPGTTTDFAFDSTDFLTSIIHKKGTNIISKAIYTKDLSGNRTSKETLFGLENYGYDQNSQLTSVASDSPETFLYDKIGNRTEDQLGQYIYDSKRQLLTEDYKNIYTYDLVGNLSTIQSKINTEVKNFTYNSENRLIKLALYEGVNLKKENLLVPKPV